MWAKWTRRMQRLKCVGEAGLHGRYPQRMDWMRDSPDVVPYTFKQTADKLGCFRFCKANSVLARALTPKHYGS